MQSTEHITCEIGVRGHHVMGPREWWREVRLVGEWLGHV
jgi:hypothetical protein